MSELTEFLDSWVDGDETIRSLYLSLKETVEHLDGTTFEFQARPGVSYSLRPKRSSQKIRKFFAIIDVIDDDPEDRWLSVCFYGDMITDPLEKGEVIPGGLSGDDGYCFDVYSYDVEMKIYLQDRLKEAWVNAESK